AYRKGDLEKGEDQTLDNHKQIVEEDSRMLFSDLIKRFKDEHYCVIEKSTKQNYEKMMPHLEFLHSQRVDEINSTVIKSLAKHWINAPRRFNRKSYEKEWQLLSCLLNFYREEVEEGADYSVPSFKKARKMTTFDPSKFVPRVLEDRELLIFLDELGKEKNPQYRDVAECQYYLSSRIGETCGLHPDQIDLSRMEVMISRTVHWDLKTWKASIKNYPKNTEHRIVEIPEPLVPTLLRLMNLCEDGGLLFRRRDGTPLNRKTIATVYNRVLKRLGYDRYVSGTHFIRRQSATAIQDVTGDLSVTQKALGHSSSRITEMYIANTRKQRGRAASALNDTFKNVERDGGKSPIQNGAVPQCPTSEGFKKISIIK
ncbi:MAG: site-specific integrase, partial [Bdellovibrionales bacterium]|nr:site-specific integrase [Bdellovibrionales bacterium]